CHASIPNPSCAPDGAGGGDPSRSPAPHRVAFRTPCPTPTAPPSGTPGLEEDAVDVRLQERVAAVDGHRGRGHLSRLHLPVEDAPGAAVVADDQLEPVRLLEEAAHAHERGVEREGDAAAAVARLHRRPARSGALAAAGAGTLAARAAQDRVALA